MVKTALAKAIAAAAEGMAKKACGTASHFGMHQAKEPEKLSKSAK